MPSEYLLSNANRLARNIKVQGILKEHHYYDLSLDGIPGPGTRKALDLYMLDKSIDPKDIDCIELWRELSEDVEEKDGIEIPLRSIQIMRYTGILTTFWLHEEVIDSFQQALDAWAGMGYSFRMTETFRTIATQARARAAKGSLCCRPGWSMHGVGRAFDCHYVRLVEGCTSDQDRAARMLKFYNTFAEFGWYNIRSNQKNIQLVHGGWNGSECWHLQSTDPPGISSHEYLRSFAYQHGATASTVERVLKSVKPKFIKWEGKK